MTTRRRAATAWRAVSAILCGLAAVTASRADTTTPVHATALIIEPFYWDTAFRLDACYYSLGLLELDGYTVQYLRPSTLGASDYRFCADASLPSVPLVTSALADSCGIVILMSHNTSDASVGQWVVESYPPATADAWMQARVDAVKVALNVSSGVDAVIDDANEVPEWKGIAIDPGIFHGLYAGDHSILWLGVCNSSGYHAFQDKGAALVYAFDYKVSASDDEAILFTYLGYLLGRGSGDADPAPQWTRSSRTAYVATDMAISARLPREHDGGQLSDITLCPAVLEYAWTQLSENHIDAHWLFDTRVDTQWPAQLAVLGGHNATPEGNAAWGDGGYGLSCSITTVPSRDAYVRLDAAYVVSATNQSLALDGNTDPLYDKLRAGVCPNGDQHKQLVTADDNPVSTVEGVWVEGGSFEYDVLSGYLVDHYGLEARDLGDTTWVDLGIVEPFDLGHHEIPMPESAGDVVRLFEMEETGAKVLYDAEATSGSMVAARDSVAASVASLLALLETKKSTLVQRPANGESLLIIAPDKDILGDATFGTYVQEYVVEYWEARGYSVYWVNTASLGSPQGDDVELRGAIKDTIAEYHTTLGVRFVLLVGDASDWRQFVGDEAPQFWNTPAWEAMRQFLITQAPQDGGRSHQMVPTWAEAENEMPPGAGYQAVYPYHMTDNPYARVVGEDDVEDVVIGRWTALFVSHLLQMATTMWTYNDAVGVKGDEFASYWYLGEGLLGYMGGQGGAFVEECYEYAIDGLPTQLIETFRESAYDVHSESVAGAMDFWNSAGTLRRPAELVAMLGIRSSKHNLVNLFDQSHPESPLFQPWWLCSCGAPVVICASCGGADFATAMTSVPYLPLCEGMRDFGKCVAFVGPTAGTSQRGNAEILRAFVRRLHEAPWRPMAESFLLARQDARTAVGESVPGRRTIDAYVFLGDPLSPFSPANYAVVDAGRPSAASDGKGAVDVMPNPGVGAIDLVVPTRDGRGRGFDRVEIIGVDGRRVRTVRLGGVGERRVKCRWDGRDDAGVRVAAGVYWARMRGRGTTEVLSRKFVLLR